jgi:hypothetical protein
MNDLNKQEREFHKLYHLVSTSGCTVSELIFGKLDMSYQDLIYELYDRIKEKREVFEKE